jgi:S-adenosylhomocysteine hydrolase
MKNVLLIINLFIIFNISSISAYSDESITDLNYSKERYLGPLKVMNKLVYMNEIDFSDTTLLIIQHIKKNSIEFIRLLKSLGFRDVLVIGKPYSRDEKALRELREFVEVHMPSNKELESLSIIENIVQPLIENNHKFICLDLGGYFSQYFYKCNKRIPGLIGVIEDTKNGIWFDVDNPPNLSFPLLSVASSILKDYAEHYFVAKAIVRNTENILVNTFQQSLTSKKILICGYGRIGINIATILKPSAIVSIWDYNPIQQIRAEIAGYNVLANIDDLSSFDVIIGITGNYAVNTELLTAKDNVILINGSTRKKEFNFPIIENNIVSEIKYSTHTQFLFDNNKTVTLLADGYPINFFGTESTPEYVLDLVFSEMFVLLQEVCLKEIKPGFYPIEKDFLHLEKKIAKYWLEK